MKTSARFLALVGLAAALVFAGAVTVRAEDYALPPFKGSL